MNEKNLEALRHSASHVMAQAVQELYPEAKLGIGPAIEDGFYYDFDVEEPFSPEDLGEIEERMKEIIKEGYEFEQTYMNKQEAINHFEEKGEQYKVELIEELDEDKVSIYKHDGFEDLCKGPHVNSTSDIKAFKLLSVAGAYWKGNENNPMLQRIYGTAFYSDDELEDHLNYLEEAKKRDHRKIGKELGYFSMPEGIGKGLILFHPKGARLRSIIENFIEEEHIKRGYKLITSPHILKSDVWEKSGHYDFYKENMFTFEIEGQDYAIKPMNCPGHILVYKSQTRSYKELPLRLFELGTVYRNEKSGVLHGLLRVRGFTQDDAHIFCLSSQITQEITGVIDFVKDIMKVFGFEEFEVELSTRPSKSIGSDEQWDKATDALMTGLERKNLDFEKNIGEGAFYGPKIDINLKDAIGRTWQCATVQCDFALPERFGLEYVGEDGNPHTPILIHRVILGSIERFIGTLLEHYAGSLPVWLAPEQVRVIPVTERSEDYAKKIQEELQQEGIRCGIELRDEKMGYKIREAEMEKIPYMTIVGDREEEKGTISVRSKKEGDEGEKDLSDFISRLKKIIKKKET